MFEIFSMEGNSCGYGYVGIAAVIGTIRFVRGWSLKPLIYLALAPTIALTIYAWTNPDLEQY